MEPAGRMVVERRRGRPEGGADVGEPGLRDREVDIPLDEQGDRARVNGGAGVQVAVGHRTRDAREAAAARGAATVVRDGTHVDAPVPHPPQNADSAEELVQAHGPSSR
jgi:hypothetical protein